MAALADDQARACRGGRVIVSSGVSMYAQQVLTEWRHWQMTRPLLVRMNQQGWLELTWRPLMIPLASCKKLVSQHHAIPTTSTGSNASPPALSRTSLPTCVLALLHHVHKVLLLSLAQGLKLLHRVDVHFVLGLGLGWLKGAREDGHLGGRAGSSW